MFCCCASIGIPEFREGNLNISQQTTTFEKFAYAQNKRGSVKKIGNKKIPDKKEEEFETNKNITPVPKRKKLMFEKVFWNFTVIACISI